MLSSETDNVLPTPPSVSVAVLGLQSQRLLRGDSIPDLKVFS